MMNIETKAKDKAHFIEAWGYEVISLNGMACSLKLEHLERYNKVREELTALIELAAENCFPEKEDINDVN